MKLDIESLHAFKTVVNTGGFTAAAEKLSLTQSAVSWKLKRLEERVGCALIRREGRSIALTDDGRELMTYADQMLAAHDAAVRHFQRSVLTGNVRLGTTDVIAVGDFGRIIGRFQRTHPGVKLQVSVELPLTILDWLEQGAIDVAIVPVDDSMMKVGDTVLWEDDLVWAQSKDWDFSGVDRIPLVSFGEKCFFRRLTSQLLNEASVPFDIVMECSSVSGVQDAVSGGVGLTLINRRLLTDDQCIWPNGANIPSPPRISYVIRTGKDELGEIEQTLIAQIQDALAPPDGSALAANAA